MKPADALKRVGELTWAEAADIEDRVGMPLDEALARRRFQTVGLVAWHLMRRQDPELKLETVMRSTTLAELAGAATEVGDQADGNPTLAGVSSNG